MNLLNADLTKVDISYPLIAAGPCRFLVSEMKLDKSKDGTKDVIVTVYTTVFPTKGSKGEQINPGHKLTERTTVTPSDKLTEEKIAQNLARLKMAITGSQSGAFMPLEQYLNKQVDAIVSIETDKDGKYADQNRLGKMQPAK